MPVNPADRIRRWHRASGLLLALFLPAHFLVLGLLIQDAARLDQFLRLADLQVVHALEVLLVSLLTLHLVLGCRVLLIEREMRMGRGGPVNLRLRWLWLGLLLASLTGGLYMVR